MALVFQPPFIQDAKITPSAFAATAANTKQTVCTAGADGTKVTALIATSTDTSDRVAQVWLTRAAVSYLIASTNVPTLSGTNGSAASVNLLGSTLLPGLPVDNDGQRYLFLVSGDTLQVSFTTSITAAKEIDVVCISGDF